MNIKLITDSSADLPENIIKAYDITVVPLRVLFGSDEYYDKVDMSPRAFFERIEQTGEMPSTSQVTPNQFIEAFSEALKGYDHVLCVTIASNASGTYQSAILAQNSVEVSRIHVIDSTLLCMGTGLLVIKIAQMIEEGLEINEIVRRANDVKARIGTIFCVDSLDYLRKGGRISASAAYIGGLLKVKPILTVENGLTKPIGKVRGTKNVLKYFLQYISETPFRDIVVSHAQNQPLADRIIQMLRQELNYTGDIIISEIGPVIGSHAGPGTISVFYLKE